MVLLPACLGAGFAFAGEVWSACEKANTDTNSMAPAIPTAFFDQDFHGFIRNSALLETEQFRSVSSGTGTVPLPDGCQRIRPTVLALEMIPESGSQCQSPLGDGSVTEVYLR